ncbi:MAG: hypothetical protein AUI10_02565 [Actinobacteria bacterium 13_2_20CM_2_72_6]|nr:MAG: hypothetical protein AUI10_02565 [Actinobacteria bacterium 13_2_20CM_2_72_6]
MYRFLLTPRWLGFAALMLALAATMVGLGLWQLSRYHERGAVNARIAAAASAAPVPLGQVVPVGHPPPSDAAWTRVHATGRYDPDHQVLARDRGLDNAVGFEVLTPLVLDDGSAEMRRIDPARLADRVPYPLAGAYVLLDEPRDAALASIRSDHENAAMNAGYVVQWWAFALLTLAGFGWAARREARGPDEFDLAELHANHPDAPVSPGI